MGTQDKTRLHFRSAAQAVKKGSFWLCPRDNVETLLKSADHELLGSPELRYVSEPSERK